MHRFDPFPEKLRRQVASGSLAFGGVQVTGPLQGPVKHPTSRSTDFSSASVPLQPGVGSHGILAPGAIGTRLLAPACE